MVGGGRWTTTSGAEAFASQRSRASSAAELAPFDWIARPSVSAHASAAAAAAQQIARVTRWLRVKAGQDKRQKTGQNWR